MKIGLIDNLIEWIGDVSETLRWKIKGYKKYRSKYYCDNCKYFREEELELPIWQRKRIVGRCLNGWNNRKYVDHMDYCPAWNERGNVNEKANQSNTTRD